MSGAREKGRWTIREEDGGRRLVAEGYALPRNPTTGKREVKVMPVSEHEEKLKRLERERDAAKKAGQEALHTAEGMRHFEAESCPECGLANYEGLCPHCRGDQDAYEHELVPPFESSLPPVDRDGEG